MLHTKLKIWIILTIFFILGVVLTILFKTSFISFAITTSSTERGKIIDRNGVILATNKKIKSLYYVYNNGCPTNQEVTDLSSFLNKFSSTFHHKISVDDINSKLQKFCKHHNKSEILLQANINDKELTFISENKFQNVIIKDELIRVYPQHEIASQVIGYVDYEKNSSNSNYVPVGKNGVELQYENDLKGVPGKTLTFKLKNKKFLWNIQSPQKGKDIQLALDYKLQQKTEEALKSQIQKTPDANAGYAVVMDVKTGEILTMVNSPDFDPNIRNTHLSSSEKEHINLLAQNKAIQKLKYDESYVNMGSTIKPLTILIGLNEKLFKPADTYLDKGSFQYNNQNNITNAAGTPTGEITPSQAIINSSNTFMTAKVAIPLFNQNNGNLDKVATIWTSYLKQFGLRSKTGVDLPFEEAGQYKLHTSGKFENGISALLNASWGGNEVHTPLQLVQYAATLANKGDKYKPKIVNAIIDNNDKKRKELKPILESSNHYPASFWDVLQNGMSNNIQEIKNLPFDVAGKTGITGSPNKQEKVINHSLFIAYAPTKDPQIAISVIIPGGDFRTKGAAPVAAKIFSAWDTFQKENKK
ncbi:penicillin-binding protein [Bacillus gaemokensis]|uniref:serine-type D-Ala-D-Ala carboxypeptidase n=1 Tax=Bacillus gaemokensis TaxID=574375 RepID=A0A073K6I5_9BACI|nr:penicillin-binding transpeptidase domain-containing protein [Bacillus gaemokensis]KEK22190.1 penicillin-binding protein [Bacillus gaemokensis]KYG34661.1 penicillin-binding protein [Bacillus gaemokensis]